MLREAVLLLLAIVVSPQSLSSPCLSTINDLALLDNFVTDLSVTRYYQLCPNKEYPIGYLDYSQQLYNGQVMIPLRPNLHIRCGDSGSKNSTCRVTGGDIQVDGTTFFGLSPQTLSNVVFEGITFVNVSKHMIFINRPGDVTFKNCDFRDNDHAVAAVLLDYSNSSNPNSELRVTFEDCVFANNRFFGSPSYPAIVVGNGRQNRLIFERSDFQNNDMVYNNTRYRTNSFLVETSGPITLTMNCFEHNLVGVSPVAVYGQSTLLSQNYADLYRGAKCPFVSTFESYDQLDTFSPKCTDFSASICLSMGTSSPTVSPSNAPTGPTPSPTDSPTRAPSSLPTMSPAPTAQPTASPTKAPTPPTEFPSTGPTGTPSIMPTGGPSIMRTSSPVGTPSHATLSPFLGDSGANSFKNPSGSSGSFWMNANLGFCCLTLVLFLLS